MSNIKKELQSKQSKDLKVFNDLEQTKDMKLLQNSTDQEDLHIALAIGHNNITRANTKHGKLIELDKNVKEYGEGIFSIEEIKNYCKEYDLLFLPANFYKANIDKQLISKLKEFRESMKEINSSISLDTTGMINSFFILAPRGAFIEQKREIKYNPAIFYKIPDIQTIQTYKLVHDWGNEFSTFRRIKGIRRINRFSMFLVDSLAMLIFVAAFISIFTNPISWWLLLALVPIFIYAILLVPNPKIGGDFIFTAKHHFHEGRWNNEQVIKKFKYIKEY